MKGAEGHLTCSRFSDRVTCRVAYGFARSGAYSCAGRTANIRLRDPLHKSFPHLQSRRPCKRDHQDMPRRDMMPADQMTDPLHKNRRLAAPGACQHQAGTVFKNDRFLLRIIKRKFAMIHPSLPPKYKKRDKNAVFVSPVSHPTPCTFFCKEQPYRF